jgi:hypothetical protein
MKAFVIAILLVITGLLLSPAETLGELEGILKPSIIDIHKDKLFVMDMEQVRVYSLKNLSLINSFGKKGEGPGEYKIIVNLPLTLKAFDDFLIVESVDKLSYFTLDGEYLKERRKQPLLLMITEIGRNFIGRKIVQPPDGSPSTTSLKIYDAEFNELKELYRQPFIQQGAFPNLKLNLGKDFLLYQVAENKIFVEKSDKGFIIDVFDFSGEKLYEIRKEFKRTPITPKDKEFLIKDLEIDPQIQRQLKRLGVEWKEFSQHFKYKFPEFFPPIKTMDIDNNRIYIKTFKTEKEKEEMIVMGLKGKILKTVFIEPTVKEWVNAIMMGVRLETIHNDKIYYIAENEDEEWELFVQDIK